MRVKIELILRRTPSLASLLLAVAILLGIPGNELSAGDIDSTKVLFQFSAEPQSTEATPLDATSSDSETRVVSLFGNLSFGDVVVGQTATGSLTIQNTGNGPLTVSGISYPIGFSGNWGGGIIAAGSSRTVTVTFTPTAVESYSGTVTVDSDRTSGINTYAVIAAGVDSTRVIALWGDLDFGNLAVGQTATRTLTIQNTGNSLLTVSSITYPIGFSGDWSGTISAGNSRSVTVTFTPTLTQSYSGMVTVNSDRTSGTNTFAVLGSGVDSTRVIALSGDLGFGNVAVGQTATRTLTIQNKGNSPLTVSSINYPVGFSGNWSGTISGGSSRSVTVTFTPTLTQSYSGMVTVNSDRTSGINTYPVLGTGAESTRVIALSGNLGFGNVSVGQIATRTLTIQNTGNTTLTVNGISYPVGFSGNWSSGTISAGSSRKVTVTFTPRALQSYSGTIIVESDRTSGTHTYAVSGTGVDFTRVITLSGNLDFGNVAVGQTATRTLTIQNTGNSPLTVSSISYPTGFSGDWSGTIEVGHWGYVSVTFAPTAVQNYSGELTVDSDHTSGTHTYAMSGIGVEPVRVIALSGDLSFGNVAVGQTAARTLTIHNTGNIPLIVSRISYPIGFSGSWSGGTISAGNSRNVTVTYAPTFAQSYSGTVMVDSNHTSGINTYAVSGIGVEPTRVIALSGDLSFGNVAEGQTAARTLTIHNTGNSPLTVSSISYPVGFSGDWGSGTISGGNSRSVTVTFSPTVAQSYGGTITVDSNRTSGTNIYAVSGIWVDLTRVIALSGNLGFGNVAVGQTATRTLTIHNTGNSPLTVSSISYPIGFSGNWSGTISAGNSRNVTVTFAPTSAQTYGGTVAVESDHTSGTNTYAMIGAGVDPERIISLSGNLGFGNVAVGQTATRTLTIQNTGNSPLTVSSISYPIGFSGSWSGGTIAANGSRSVTVSFAPTSAQRYSGMITVDSNSTSGTNTYTVSGIGVDPVRVIALSGDLGFGNVAVGQTATRSLIIQNTGNSPITVSSISYPIGFSDNWNGGTISPGHSRGLTVTFSPTAAQSYSGTMTVLSDHTSGTNTYAVSGIGVDPARVIVLSGDLSFGNVAVGQTAARILTIHNTGNSPLTVSSISYPTGFRGDWSSGMISAGNSRSVTVTFAPTVVQSYGGTITVDSNLTSGTNTYDLSGIGVAPVRVIALSGDLSFGNVTVGQIATRTFTIQNTGNSPLTVSSISYPVDFSGNWSSGTIAVGGSRTVTVTFAPTAAQSYSGTVTVVSDRTDGIHTYVMSGTGLSAVPLGVAVGQPSWIFSTGGSAGWFGQSVVTRNGGSAAQSRSIMDYQQSSMETVVDGSGTFSFWWKVSSEACCDYLEFSINGTVQDFIRGEVDWHQKSYILSTGMNTLRWRYIKDGSVAIGQDAGWVEGIIWVPSQQPPNFTTYAQWVSQLGFVGDESAPSYRHGPINLSNLEAFAMGLDPRTASLEGLPQIVPDLSTANELVVSYRFDPAAVGVSYWFEGSVDLTEWHVQQPLDETLTDSDESIELREATFATGLEDNLFIRILYRLEESTMD